MISAVDNNNGQPRTTMDNNPRCYMHLWCRFWLTLRYYVRRKTKNAIIIHDLRWLQEVGIGIGMGPFCLKQYFEEKNWQNFYTWGNSNKNVKTSKIFDKAHIDRLMVEYDRWWWLNGCTCDKSWWAERRGNWSIENDLSLPLLPVARQSDHPPTT